jgi:cleavage and polyadenylation specificity factor subunit 1
MFDDETGAEPKIVSASLADPFLLLMRDDASIFVVQCDGNNELEEVERIDDTLLATKWLSGCLYTDSNCCFTKPATDKGLAEGENVMLFLLSTEGALYVCSIPLLSLSSTNT